MSVCGGWGACGCGGGWVRGACMGCVWGGVGEDVHGVRVSACGGGGGV